MSTRESHEVWARRVARWRKSGLSLEAFADREGVKPATLSWWRSELRRRARASAERPVFVEVEPIVVEAAREKIEVALANGRVVRVPSAFDDAVLCRVLTVAERS